MGTEYVPSVLLTMLGRNTEPPASSQSLHLVTPVFHSWEVRSTRKIGLTGFEMVLVLQGTNIWDTPSTLTQSTTCSRVILVSLIGWNGAGDLRGETDQLDGTATLAALLLKQNNLTDTNQGCYCSHLDFSEHPTCLGLGVGCFWAQFWDSPFHSLLIMHFSLLIKLVESDGKKNVQGEHWAYHAYYYISQGITETKRQSLFSSK